MEVPACRWSRTYRLKGRAGELLYLVVPPSISYCALSAHTRVAVLLTLSSIARRSRSLDLGDDGISRPVAVALIGCNRTRYVGRGIANGACLLDARTQDVRRDGLMVASTDAVVGPARAVTRRTSHGVVKDGVPASSPRGREASPGTRLQRAPCGVAVDGPRARSLIAARRDKRNEGDQMQ